MKLDDKIIENIIRQVIEEELSNQKSSKFIDSSGVGVVKLDAVIPEKFDTGNPRDEVYVSDIYTLEESPRIGAGLMEMKKSTFDWFLKYDEIDYIIEGSLEIVIDGRKVIGNKGDVMLIPKNSKIKFSVPEYAKFLYVVYPANWQQL